jgi:NAD(P)-dependent dehydrogenase (short-subunit alcohol dehydrogenase family)
MANQKIALVTGGSRGLGRDMVLNLAKKGIASVFTYQHQQEAAAKVVEEVKALGQQSVSLQLDTAEVKTFDDFVGRLKQVLQNTFQADKIDFLINNAGIGIYAAYTDTTEDQLDLLMNIHFKGPYILTQKLLPLMNDGGGIINISSGLARFSFPGSSAYGAMKGAIEVLTRYQAKELGARGIRSNVVAPGAIETDFGGGRTRDNKAVNQQIASATALGRVGLPDDVGGVVAFLCTDDAKWINAQRIEVSGGMMI